MIRSRPRFEEAPRGLTNAEVAYYLGISSSQFAKLSKKLSKAGFPSPNQITRRYDRHSIDHWLDTHSGLIECSPLGAAGERFEQWSQS